LTIGRWASPALMFRALLILSTPYLTAVHHQRFLNEDFESVSRFQKTV